MQTLIAATRLDAVLNTLVDGAVIIDSQGTVQLINPACERIFGHPSGDVVGRNVRLLMPEPYHGEHDDYVANYVRTGDAQIIGHGREVEGLRRNGEVFPMDLAVGEMEVEGRTLFVGILRDLSERHARQRDYDELQARHFHLSRVAAMNEMGAAIAHEINQPLAAVANYLETAKLLLAKPGGDSSTREVLDLALEQNRRASEIISRMRQFIERGDARRERLDIDEIIDAALLLGMSKFRTAGVEVRRDSGQLAAPVEGDPVQVQQVLVNLIRNACEAMAHADRKVLGVSVEPDPESEGFARISVSDTGTGLGGDVMTDLFKAFTSTKTGGLGVGLSISRSIVRAHGGRIWAENRSCSDTAPGGGAVFRFTLPVGGGDEA